MDGNVQSEGLDEIVLALRATHKCVAAVLYGSLATADATATSDYDVAGFCDIPKPHRIAGSWRNSYLDVFLYPLTRLQQPGPELIHLRNARILFDTGDRAAARLLCALQEIFVKGPEPLSRDEAIARRAWAWKMLDRAKQLDIEGNFRRAWLLTALLEDHFLLSRRWYLGPKKSLAQLKAADSQLYALFEAALKPESSLSAIEHLVQAVVGRRDENAAAMELHKSEPGTSDV